jgi:hypothetical protein
MHKSLYKKLNRSRSCFYSLVLLLSLSWVACNTEAPLLEAGTEAGTSAGSSGTEAGMPAGSEGGSEAGMPAGNEAGTEAGTDSGTPAGSEAGMPAGNEAGMSAGSEAGTDGGSEGGMEVDRGPLPEPKTTTLSPPAAIATAASHAGSNSCEGTWVREARGWIVDEVGNPLPGAKAQFCIRVYGTGELLCLMPATSGEDGYFSLPIPEDVSCIEEAAIRSILPRTELSSMYCHGETDNLGSDYVLRMNDPLVLYQTRPATSVSDMGDGSDPVTIEFMGDLQVTLIPNDLYGPTQVSDLESRPVPVDGPGLCFLEEDHHIDGLFNFYPEGDLFGSQAALKFPNTMGYQAGTEVMLYTLGNLDCSIVGQEEGIEEAAWNSFATAVVDAGGLWIEANMEQGLPCFSWLGYGLMPMNEE